MRSPPKILNEGSYCIVILYFVMFLDFVIHEYGIEVENFISSVVIGDHYVCK